MFLTTLHSIVDGFVDCENKSNLLSSFHYVHGSWIVVIGSLTPQSRFLTTKSIIVTKKIGNLRHSQLVKVVGFLVVLKMTCS